MKWRTKAPLPFADGELAAGVLLEEVSRNKLSDLDRKALDKARKIERAQRKPRSIPVKWKGRVRLISAADLVVPRVWVIDTETTGRTASCRVIEIAIVVVDGDQVTDTRSVLVQAPRSAMRGKEWEGALRTHQIAVEDILAAPPADRVGKRLAAWYHRQGKPPCVAWPTAFDARLCDQTWPGLGLYWPKDLCIKRLWSRVVGGRAPRLATAAEQLGVTPPAGRAHRAAFDARLAADIMLGLLQRQSDRPELQPLELSPTAAAAEQRIQAAMELG